MARKKLVKLGELQPNGKKEISEEKLERLRHYGFTKGQSGNPDGPRPGAVRLSTAIQAVANRVNSKTGLTYLQTLLAVMLIEAIEGDKETREMLFDRGWGTLIQKNVLMQLGGDILQIAKGLGLDANDLQGSPAIRGLLEASEIAETDRFGIEGDSRSEANEGASTVEDNHSNS